MDKGGKGFLFIFFFSKNTVVKEQLYFLFV
jgi:hypothetical protein